MADGADVGLADQAESDSQKWRVRYQGDGFYKLVGKQSGKCLCVSSGSTADGAPLQQGPDDGSNAMQWRMDAVDTADAWGQWSWVPNVYP